MPYAELPGPRVAYDLNGTVATIRCALDSIVRDIVPAGLAAMNSERNNIFGVMANASGTNGVEWQSTVDDITQQHIFLLFPVPLQLFGLFIAWTGQNSSSTPYATGVDVQTSLNSTNGVDGDWNTLFTNHIANPAGDFVTATGVSYGGGAIGVGTRPINDAYRRSFDVEGTGIKSVNGPATRNVRSLRFTRQSSGSFNDGSSGNGVVLHLYGQPEEDTVTDKLEFWASSVALPMAADAMDWGDIVPSSSQDRTFRIKNLSVSKTATSVVISAQNSVATTTPAPKDEFVFSLDGSTWTSTVTIGALSPGAVSGTVYVRRVTPSNAVLSNWASRFVADVTGGWS